jgi:type IV secretion system protein VirB11
VNRPGRVFTRGGSLWQEHAVPELTHEYLDSLIRALAVFNGLPMGPMLTVILPGGQRGQVVREPACVRGFTPVVIRKHAPAAFGLEELASKGVFERARDVSFHRPTEEEVVRLMAEAGFERLEEGEARLLTLKREGALEEFCREAVLLRRNIVIAGKTFSGKTTLGRALIAEVPIDERVVTIEDVHEMELGNPNHVALLYGEGEGRESADACLTASMRLSPDRIFLAELRGKEAWQYVMGLNTGHPGSVTTTHANSATAAFERIASLIKNSEVGPGLERSEIRRELHQALDVVLYMAEWKVTEVFYDPIFKREELTGKSVTQRPRGASFRESKPRRPARDKR